MMIKCAFLLSLAVSLYAQENKPDCAVLDLEGMGVDSVTSKTLSEKIRTEVFQTNAVRLVERNRMDQILAEQGFQQTGCTSSECRVETGRLLGVSQLVVGTVSYLASSETWSLSLSLLDVETGAVLQMQQWTGEYGVEHVLQEGIPILVQKLFKPSTASSPVQVVPSPKPEPTAQPASVPASASVPFSPLGIAFIYPVQIPLSDVAIYGLSVNALYGRCFRVYGLTVGVASEVKERMYGMQAGVYSNSEGMLMGLQAGIYNHANEVRGAQIGLFNDCKTLLGVQIGIMNRVRGRSSANGWIPILNMGF